MDEPTAGLDPGERNRFYNLLSEIGENVIVILSTHIVEDVKELCSTMAIINGGRVLYAGSPETALLQLAGKIWEKVIAKAEIDGYQGRFRVISSKFVADKPIIHINFYSFMSAQYEVAREEKGGITYEVYYYKDHATNVPRTLRSMQKSIEYYTRHFGPYYHKQCRIIEFPRIVSFAQAFPGTMPYAESIGFIENYTAEKDDIDMVYYVVAHEMGHQYWAHQACGADVQGSEMTTETFAQYSALMVMEHEYGCDIMRKFLEYELDRYLRDRLKELPLGKCEGQGLYPLPQGFARGVLPERNDR